MDIRNMSIMDDSKRSNTRTSILVKGIFAIGILAGCSYNVFALGCYRLSDVCSGFSGFSDNPPVKDGYYAQGEPMIVFQVLGPYGVLVKNDPRHHIPEVPDKVVFVRLKTEGLSDGVEFHPNPDLFRCTGTYSYESGMGTQRTVPAFVHCSREEADTFWAKVEEAKKQEKEDEKRRQQALREQAIKEQPMRKEFAANLISKLDFNYRKRFFVARDDHDFSSPIDIRIKHFAWNGLVKAKEECKWLDFLNITDAILSDYDTVKNEYDLFPETNEITRLCSELTNKSFKVSTPIGIHQLGDTFNNVIRSVRNNEPQIHYYSGNDFPTIFVYTDSIRPFDDINYFLFEGAAVRRSRSSSKRGVIPNFMRRNGSRNKYAKGTDTKETAEEKIFEKITSLGKQLSEKEISMQEYMTQMRKIIPEFDRWINEKFVNLVAPTERPSFIEETKNSKDTEAQARQARYAEEKLSGLSFNLGSYFNMQKAARQYLASATVTENKWDILRDTQKSRNWLGMLGAIADREMKYYPTIEKIDELVEQLKKSRFHAEFLFTHRGRGYWAACQFGFVEDARLFAVSDVGSSDHDNASFMIDFSLTDKKDKYIYATNSEPRNEAGEKEDEMRSMIRKLDNERRLGRITEMEMSKRKQKLLEDFGKRFEVWLSTSTIPTYLVGEKIRDRVKKLSSTNKSQSANQTSKKAPCPDCNGSRYISKGQCGKCGGAGKYRTQVTRGIGGRASGGRMTQCDKCKGKGEIKELCTTCRGTGRVKR